ncbi:MAG: SDR family NAD(P)-dependent oxidoreductase, partial [Solirubrobacterales bacterium]
MAVGDPRVAVVGVACRLPRAPDPDAFWRLLEGGQHSIREVPAERLASSGHVSAGDALGLESGARFGAFLDGVDQFDPAFFGISPREAAAMDPQQRLVLELAWEALEDARIAPEAVRGDEAGVFLGSIGSDYSNLTHRSGPDAIGRHTMTGLNRSIIANRVSYTLGLTGPSLTVDAAQSSSLVAVHLACESLRKGEATLALAGGVHLNLDPRVALGAARFGGLSPDGRCFTFDSRANGYVRGEGGGVVALKPLSAAEADGDRVYCVIRGGAVNNDGATDGLTVPSQAAQESVMRSAYMQAGLERSSVQYVELHGTGTAVGDPIEAAALGAALGAERQDADRLPVGSAKTNVGHLEGAAGVVGLIKATLAIERRQIPASLNFSEPNPEIPLDELGIRVQDDHGAWPHDDRPLVAGVSSFGMGGTNCHLVLEEAPAAAAAPVASDGTPPLPAAVSLPLSARSGAALGEAASRLASHLRDNPGLEPLDVAYSLATTRAAFEQRAVVLAEDRASLLADLAALAEGTEAPRVRRGVAAAGGAAFLFPGQGSQWEGMGLELLDSSPLFAASMDECEQALEPFVDWSLAEVLRESPASWLDRLDVVQPALFALMVSLGKLWRACGVEPEVVVGHSQGEIAAAHVAGALSLDDAARVVAERSKAMTKIAGKGTMVSVLLSPEQLQPRLEPHGGKVSVAAINGPASVVVSGDPEALDALVAGCEAEGVRAQRVAVDYAAHSPQIDALREELLAAFAPISPRRGEIPLHSTVTGEPIDGAELDAEYWYRNLRETVRLQPVLRSLLERGQRTFVEVSAHPVLGLPVRETAEALEGEEATALATLRREEGGPRRFTLSLAEAHVAGASPDWNAVFAGSGAGVVPLPTYPFQRERFWLDALDEGDGEAEGPVTGEAEFWRAVEQEDPAALEQMLGAGKEGDSALGDALPVLAAWRRQRQELAGLEGLRYQDRWNPIADPPASALSGSWIVVTEAGRRGDAGIEAVVEAIESSGARLERVELDLAAGDVDALADRLGSSAGLEGVLSLLQLDEGPQAVDGSPALEATARLAGALAEAELEARLWIVTRGAVSTADEDVLPRPLQAQLWGLGRSIALEAPGQWGGLVDLPETAGEQDLARLCGLLGHAGDEDQLAIRPGGVFARRLVRAPQEPAGGKWRPAPGGTVLLTGADEELGGRLAEWLEECGAAHVLTISSADLGDRGRLEAALASVPASRPLTAVLHAAAEQVVAGARHLHELTEELDLSAFLLCASSAATIGAAGEGAPAAAGAYLDALARHRRGIGLPATAIAWGPWAISDERDAEERDLYGVAELDPQAALALLGQALGSGAAALTVVDVDWRRFAPLFAAGRARPLLEGVPEAAQSIDDVPPDEAASGGLAGDLAALAEEERGDFVLGLVRREVAAVLGHGSAGAVEPERAFKDLGFDSLAAVELRDRLHAATGMRLPAPVVFNHPTSARLADFLHLRAAGQAEPSGIRAVTAIDRDEPIAIVGMACRYPGGVSSPRELWRLVAEGRDGISGFPSDRGWDLDRLYHPDPDNPGTSYSREGGFLADAAGFDAEFFGIAPREALAMDPQQRLLLESCWEALEAAGIDPASLRGEPAGVFAGMSSQDYTAGLQAWQAELEGYRLTGSSTSILSGRVAYTLGLEGPAITIDTACSSSLVAMHLAAQALRGGECSLALAGGATILSSPGMFTEFARQRGLAPDGRCKSFADAADGTGWSEGVGMLVLERLADTKRAGRQVLAVIRGSAVNQDGASNGLTAPNGPSQERVIRQALASADLAPQDVDAVEAHGTGTTLGDPIEAGALLATYGQDREQPLKLGSIKSNIGHSQAAAGVAGVIKMTLAMREGVLPRTLHVDRPSSKVEWESGAIELLTEPQAWPSGDRPRRAGISSFGISGTNAHLILEEAPAASGAGPAPAPEQAGGGHTAQPLPGPIPLPLSARSGAALAEAAERLAAHLRQDPELDPVDVAYSLATTRTLFGERAVALGGERAELLDSLDAIAAGEPSPNVLLGSAGGGSVAYLFTGQGSQRIGMGAELHAAHPAFRLAFDEACEQLDPLLEAPLGEVVFGDRPGAEALLESTAFAQPALFALQTALFRTLESSGLSPDLLAGHSVGEISAAHLAGVLSLPEAAKLIAARGRLMAALPAGGAMLAIEASEEEAIEAIAGREAELSIAAINGPAAAVLSGAEEAIEAVRADWGERGRKSKRLTVSHAFHSALMEPMLGEFEALAASLDFQPPQIPIVSNLTGELLSPEQAADPAYWVRHAREPVRFAAAVATLDREGARTYLELGPDGILTAMAEECLDAADSTPALIPTLREGRPEAEALTRALGRAYAAGAAVEWEAFFAASGARPVPLPTYPFQRERYWLAAGSGAADASAIGQGDPDHPMLAAAIEDPRGDGVILTGLISAQAQPWLADHVIFETIILPGTAFAELALRAGAEVGAQTVEELTLQAPLTLPEGGAAQLQVRVSAADEDGRREIAIHSRPDGEEGGEWNQHAAGTLLHEAAEHEPLEVWPPAGAEPREVEHVYEEIVERGLELGPAFHCMTAAWQRGNEFFAEVSLGPEQRQEATRFGIHPVLLDAALHTTMLNASGVEEHRQLGARLPFSWRGVCLGASGADRLRVKTVFNDDWDVSLSLADAEGAPIGTVGSLALRPVAAEQFQLPGSSADGLLDLEWTEASLPDVGGEGADDAVLREVPFERGASPGEAALAATTAALELVQEWLGGDAGESARLTVLTRNAMATASGEAPDPASAAIWGLLRSAQSEHPGRFALIDSDGSEESEQALATALAAGAEAPQLALRKGRALEPRLVRVTAGEGEASPPIDPERTVLVTGGTGGLGALVSRHLAEHHGARHLLLLSRSGEAAPGAAELKEELSGLGAKVTIAACDVSSRKALQGVLDSVPAEHPLGAVIHAAGTIADGTIESLGPEQLRHVLAPKAEAAWNLHELTAGMGLSSFVLFSSVAGTIGFAGQANYAAANVFLDALARRRQAEGLAATSIGWGLWQRQSGMTAELDESELARMGRAGVGALSDEQGLELFDAALRGDRAQALAVRLDRAGLRAQASAGTLPAIFSGLVRVPARRKKTGAGALATKLATLPEDQREPFVLDLVRAEIASVLGHDSADSIGPDKAFKELGFDSLAAVELRNRLNAASGRRLPATVVFNRPSPKALAEYLLGEVTAGGTQKRVAVRAQVSEEPIAIVGMACRYPAGVASPAALWSLVAGGRDAISEFPTDRGWDLERLYDPDPDQPDTSYSREGGFLIDPGEFDPEFFGIGPREALAMDPQQRLLLETSWEALEDAGIDPATLRGSATGVFAGVSAQDYTGGMRGPERELEGFRLTGSSTSVASGRVAYTLGLEGPAITVDTACSSSLVAMHLAAQALRSGECPVALTGGATILASPGMFTEFARQRGLAPDGRSKSFSEAADGVTWSEGVGMLVLERLSDAQRNGHHVLATLRGSAVNQDGASNGLTAPNGTSQEQVIRQALANAGLAPKDVDAVEGHGTGTTLGDPIEAGALLATYGQDREEPLWLGSIKSNIGHGIAAAGVAGVIKMTMAMREGVLPKTLHVDAPSSKVDWEAGKVELITEPREWRPAGRPRRAGVSSFGISGTNAHVIVEEAPASVAPEPGAAGQGGEGDARPLPASVPLLLSAKSEPALSEAAARLAAHLRSNPNLDLGDVAYSLATTRAAFERRAAVIGATREQLLAGLAAIEQGAPSPDAIAARAQEGRLAYLFTGQGSQRPGMGKGLYETSPPFAQALDQACDALDPHLDRPLKELLFAEEGSAEAELLDQTAFTQPALFALELALFRQTERLGLKPDYLTGHSIGEITAAHVAGVLSLPDAAKLVAARATLMGALPAGGAMVAIEASEEEVAEAIAERADELSIAAVNGPGAVVISGAVEPVLDVQSHFGELGRKTKRLSVSHAFHSPLMEPMLGEFAEVAGSLEYSEPRIPVVSNLSGEILSAEQATDPAYWVSHVREAVRFADAVATLNRQGVTTFLELGPDAVLTAMAASCLDERSGVTLIPTLRSGRDEAGALASALASAHAAGAKVDWAAFFEGTGAKRVPLPTYPFQRERYWLTASPSAADAGAIGQREVDHPLLAAAIEDPEGERLTLTGSISLSTHPWLADHAVLDTVILPGTAFLELALRAGEEAGAETIEELTLQAPLNLPEGVAVSLQVSVAEPGEQGGRPISIHSRAAAEGEAGEWVLHATGTLGTETRAQPRPLGPWPPEGAEAIETEFAYDRLAEHGFAYGPAFQGLTGVWRDGEGIYAEVSLPEGQRAEAGRHSIHPALLDAALHGLTLALTEGGGATQLPFAWGQVALHAEGAAGLRVRFEADGDAFGLSVFDRDDAPVASIGSLSTRAVSGEQLGGGQDRGRLFGLEWKEIPFAGHDGETPGGLATLGALTLPGAERYEGVAALAEAVQGGEPAPGTVLFEPRPEAKRQLAKASRAATEDTLELLREWLAEAELASCRLVLVTRGALCASPEDSPELPAAALGGLLRSAQAEHPGRFALIDTDTGEASRDALIAAAAQAEEPQLALRDGVALAPRLSPRPGQAGEEGVSIDPERTVLVTGGTGGLGALVSHHLAEHHGARHLLLLSRSGEEAPGAAELKEELSGLGAEVTIAACDVSSRKALQEALDSIPAEHPLGAVIHAAGTIADGLVDSMDGEKLQRAFAPKAEGAWRLHELTKGLDLSAFVLFSSVAGLMGSPGQGNYAAANSFLDALAQLRRREGLAATSIAWGLWAGGGMASSLGDADLKRLERTGIAALSEQQGLALFDAALAEGESLSVALDVNRKGLRSLAKAGIVPPLLRGLVRVPRQRAGAASAALQERLASRSAEEREEMVLELVKAEVAAVIGHESAAAVDPSKAFQDLGFDSLAAVELRNRLVATSGVALQPTVVFDYPTASGLAQHLLGELTASGSARKAVARAQTSEEPIAIVGMACRYPGGIASPTELWRLLSGEGDGISEFPTDRGWDPERLYDPDPDNPGTSYSREGGFLHDAAH